MDEAFPATAPEQPIEPPPAEQSHSVVDFTSPRPSELGQSQPPVEEQLSGDPTQPPVAEQPQEQPASTEQPTSDGVPEVEAAAEQDQPWDAEKIKATVKDLQDRTEALRAQLGEVNTDLKSLELIHEDNWVKLRLKIKSNRGTEESGISQQGTAIRLHRALWTPEGVRELSAVYDPSNEQMPISGRLLRLTPENDKTTAQPIALNSEQIQWVTEHVMGQLDMGVADSEYIAAGGLKKEIAEIMGLDPI